MTNRELEKIIEKITYNNDQKSFKILYYFYFNKLYTLAISIVKSPEEAEEVVNDTLFSIWNQRKQLMEVRHFKTYIFTAVKNKSLNALIKLKTHQHLNIDELDKISYRSDQNADDKIYAEELVCILNRSIEKLPRQSKLIFRMVRENHLKHKEVAELLNMSVKAVEYHMGSALKKIGETYIGEYGNIKRSNVKKHPGI